jgi:L-threonylcarbamoyladenylate synthase
MVEMISISRHHYRGALQKAAEVVRAGGVILYPTDTLYGLGGNALEQKVAERILRIKGSEPNKPMSVTMSDIRMIERYCEVDEWQREVLNKNLPGPFTFLLKIKAPIPVAAEGKLGVRIPDYTFAHTLSGIADLPVISTSANPSGQDAPSRFEDVNPGIVGSVDLAINDGVTKYQGPSAVVDLVEKKIIRSGVSGIELSSY